MEGSNAKQSVTTAVRTRDSISWRLEQQGCPFGPTVQWWPKRFWVGSPFRTAKAWRTASLRAFSSAPVDRSTGKHRSAKS
eukprot:13073591-Alexandrium_andersonii.AAC.2